MKTIYYEPTKIKSNFSIDEIYTIHYFEYHKNYTFGGESHNFWELIYVDEGEIVVTADEEEYLLKKNQLLIHAPNEFHSVRSNRVEAPNVIIVSFSSKDAILDKLCKKFFYINEFERSLLTGIVREAGLAFSNDLSDPDYKKLERRENADALSEQMLLILLEELIITLLRRDGLERYKLPKEQQGSIESQFSALTKWIDKNIDRNFKVSDLQAEMLLNKTALEYMFREKAGMGAIAYCRQRKIEAAKKMLREDDFNISQISERLGFSSVHYFSRTFRKLEGESPSEYARKSRNLKDHKN